MADNIIDWNKIKAEYIRNEKSSYRKLAEKYGVSFNTLKKRASTENWTELRKQKYHKSTTKIVERASEHDARKADTIQDIADDILLSIKKGIDDGSLIKNAKDLRSLTGAIKDIQDIKGVKSELDLEEQRARIEKLRREAQKDTNTFDDSKYGVVILPPIMEVPND